MTCDRFQPYDIPARFHQIWLGDQHPPAIFYEWAETWRRHNPAWDLILWCEHRELIDRDSPWTLSELPPLVNDDLIPLCAKWVGDGPRLACAADIIRYELVMQFGGVYLDLDVEAFKPIDPVLGGVRLFNADEFGPAYGNYCFGATPNHPAMVEVVRGIRTQFREHDPDRRTPENRWGRPLSERRVKRIKRQRVRNWLRRRMLIPPAYRAPHPGLISPVLLTGPTYLFETLEGHPDLVRFPYMLFNPLHAYGDYRQVTSWPEVSIANHHFYGTWYDREKYTPDGSFRKGSTPGRRFKGPADEETAMGSDAVLANGRKRETQAQTVDATGGGNPGVLPLPEVQNGDSVGQPNEPDPLGRLYIPLDQV